MVLACRRDVHVPATKGYVTVSTHRYTVSDGFIHTWVLTSRYALQAYKVCFCWMTSINAQHSRYVKSILRNLSGTAQNTGLTSSKLRSKRNDASMSQHLSGCGIDSACNNVQSFGEAAALIELQHATSSYQQSCEGLHL